MSDLNLYWAEEAFGEPYTPQDYRWMKSTRRNGMILGGAACVLTTGFLLSGAVYLTVDRSPRVAISSYEIEVASQAAPQPLPAPAQAPAARREINAPAPAARVETTVDARMSQKAAAPITTAPNQAVASKAAAAPREVKIKTAPAPAPVKTQADASAVPKARIQPGKAPEVLAPPAAAPAAKPEPDTRVGISKGADSKPTDIASGEKLGIREIHPDGIVMQNGRKVKNGSPLPNGEILMGTDAGKGMAETDRRVLVLTP